jgi:hypothetical protein
MIIMMRLRQIVFVSRININTNRSNISSTNNADSD